MISEDKKHPFLVTQWCSISSVSICNIITVLAIVIPYFTSYCVSSPPRFVLHRGLRLSSLCWVSGRHHTQWNIPVKGSHSSLHVWITKRQYFPGSQGCYLSCQNISIIQYCVVFNNEGVLVHQSLKFLSKQTWSWPCKRTLYTGRGTWCSFWLVNAFVCSTKTWKNQTLGATFSKCDICVLCESTHAQSAVGKKYYWHAN